MALIYKIQNKENGKVYIGQTYYSLEWRLNNDFCGHFKRAFKENVHQSKLYAALRKYGKDGFTYEVLEEIPNEDFASYEQLKAWLNRKEDYYIQQYDAISAGYNMLKGTKGYSGWSKEAREQWGQQVRQRNIEHPEIVEKQSISVCKTYSTGEPQKKISASVKQAHREHPEILDKISKRSSGSIWMYRTIDNIEERKFASPEQVDIYLQQGFIIGLPPSMKDSCCYNQLGKPRTEEEKAKISKTLTGKKKTKEHAKHISEGLTGIKRSEQTKKNVSIGTKLAMANLSKEKKQQMKEKASLAFRNRRKVTNGTETRFVKGEELEKLLAEGWKYGSGKTYVNNGKEAKLIYHHELENYLSKGYVRGRILP